MKPSTSLTIYIASSFRSLHAVHLLGDALSGRGHKVLDWTKFAPPLPDDMTPEERRQALDTDERGEIFAFCVEACARADLVIYLGPAGQDAGTEIGIAYNAGVPVYGLPGPLEAPGLVLAKAVSRWFTNVRELIAGVEEFAEEFPLEAAVRKTGTCIECGIIPEILFGDYCMRCGFKVLRQTLREQP
jgi:hypothetical protein